MKKFLVFLMILAVAGGVFAQADTGHWSVSGSAEFGTTFNLNQTPKALTDSTSNWDDGPDGSVTFGYEKEVRGGTFKTGITLSMPEGDGGISFTYDHTDFYLSVGLDNVIANLYGSAPVDIYDAGTSLYGWWKFLDGNLKIETAYFGSDGSLWVSNDTGIGLGSTRPTLNSDWSNAGDPWTKLSDKYGVGRNYLLTEYTLGDFSFGFVLPKIFYSGTTADPTGQTKIIDIFKNTKLGIKGSIDPISFAAHVSFMSLALSPIRAVALYAGAEYKVTDEFTVGLNVNAGFNDDDNDNFLLTTGVKAAYGNDLFGASLGIGYAKVRADKGIGELTPSLTFNIDPDYLQFALDATINYDFQVKSSLIEVTPSLNYNFLGTGAGNWDTGMYLGYRFKTTKASGSGRVINTNAIHLGLKWAF